MTTTDDRDRAASPAALLLPMAGHTAGKRSPVTCHLKCADACFHPVPNTQRQRVLPGHREREHDPTVGAVGRGRRRAARSSSARAVADAQPAAAWGRPAAGKLPFTPIAPVAASVDAVRRPGGVPVVADHPLGRPAVLDARRVRPERARPRSCRSASSATTTTTWTSSRGRRATRAVLVANQEYTNENIMFPPATTPERARRAAPRSRSPRTAWRSCSCTARASASRGRTPSEHRYNRRITGEHPVHVQRPGRRLGAAADGRRTRRARTVARARSATAPAGPPRGARCCPARRTSTATSAPPAPARRTCATAWRTGRPRAAGSRSTRGSTPGPPATRTSRTGSGGSSRSTRSTRTARPSSTPRSAGSSTRAPTSSSAAAGRAVAYMGDDERFDYLYKFVSTDTLPAGGEPAEPRGTTRRCSPPAACTSPGSPATRRSRRSPAPGRCRRTARSTARASGSRS